MLIASVGGWQNPETAERALAEGVSYVDKCGETLTVPADSVVISAGMKAKRDEAMSFYGCTSHFYQIGDCNTPATVQQAMRSAFATASQI